MKLYTKCIRRNVLIFIKEKKSNVTEREDSKRSLFLPQCYHSMFITLDQNLHTEIPIILRQVIKILEAGQVLDYKD